MKHNGCRGDHGSVALEQRLQGCPASPTVPGGAAPGLHSRDPPGSTPILARIEACRTSLEALLNTVERRRIIAHFKLKWQSEKSLELSMIRRVIALISTVWRRCSAAALPAAEQCLRCGCVIGTFCPLLWRITLKRLLHCWLAAKGMCGSASPLTHGELERAPRSLQDPCQRRVPGDQRANDP